MNDDIIIGIDEAGKSSLIGIMVVVAVSAPRFYEKRFARLNIRDSKLMGLATRKNYYDFLRWNLLDISVVHITPEEIDKVVFRKNKKIKNLNWLIAHKMAKAALNISKTGKEIIYADAITKNSLVFKNFIEKETGLVTNMEVGMDGINSICSAASIIATEERYRYIKKLKERGIDIVNGECSDLTAIEWASKHPDSKLVRWSWKSVKNTK